MRSLLRFSLTAFLFALGINGRLTAQAPLGEFVLHPTIMPLAEEDKGKLPERLQVKPTKPEVGASTTLFPTIVAEEDGDGAAPGGGEAGGACSEPKPFWALSPPVTRFPLPGWYILGPNGPGYYSLAD